MDSEQITKLDELLQQAKLDLVNWITTCNLSYRQMSRQTGLDVKQLHRVKQGIYPKAETLIEVLKKL